jgi:hypothetical protein
VKIETFWCKYVNLIILQIWRRIIELKCTVEVSTTREFWLQGTMLKVAPVSTQYLSLVNSSVKKIKPAFAGKCIDVAVAGVGKAAEPKEVRRRISFLTKNRAECTC